MIVTGGDVYSIRFKEGLEIFVSKKCKRILQYISMRKISDIQCILLLPSLLDEQCIPLNVGIN